MYIFCAKINFLAEYTQSGSTMVPVGPPLRNTQGSPPSGRVVVHLPNC
jgi:hypothetical protein